MHHLFSLKHRLSLSLTIFFLGATLHAQQTTVPEPPPAPVPVQTADATTTPQLSLTVSSSADTDQPAPPVDLQAPQPTAGAQSSAQSSNQSSNQSTDQSPQQPKRILGILPNFRAVSTDQHLPPQSVKEKFITASEDSFDYSALFVPVALAGYNLERNNDPEFGGGGLGYARYLWHSAVDQTSENYFVEFIGPAVTHEDTRYYTLGHGGLFKRTAYALTRSVITRSDSGKEVFNASEVIGSGASSGLSTLYYPVRERSFGNTADQWGVNVGVDALSFVVKEFWPDINHYLFHGAPPSQALAHQ